MKDKKLRERSAGFIVVRPRGSSWEVLGLRVWGKIDIPKGHVEPGESDLEAAIRECREEAGLSIDPNRDMVWGLGAHTNVRKHKDVVIYLAVTDQEPMIMPNPETKQYEHDGYHWLTWDEMKRRCYPYLVDSVNWAQEIIERRV